MTTPNPAIDKIRKLLALAKSANEHEAARSLAKAMQLAAENDISLNTVRAIENDITHAQSQAAPKAQYELWECNLYSSIARLFGCAVMTQTRYDIDCHGWRETFVLYGRERDRQVADHVAAYLRRELLRLFKANKAAISKNRKISAYKIRQSFLLGAGVRVVATARELYADLGPAADQMATTALVLRRGDLARQYMHQANPNLRTVERNPALDNHAWRQGAAAARAVALYKSINTNPPARPAAMIGG